MNRKVRLEAMKDNENNIVYPIRILLILAQRLGNVSGSTIAEVLSTAYQRTDMTVKWTPGESRVMVAQKPPSAGGALRMLQPEKPISQPCIRTYDKKSTISLLHSHAYYRTICGVALVRTLAI